MSSAESLIIDPAKKDKYLAIIDKAFREWHAREWYFLPFEEFTKTSSASFLAYVRGFLALANEEGIIDIGKAREALQASMGEYFREEKLEKTVIFYQDGGWNYL